MPSSLGYKEVSWGRGRKCLDRLINHYLRASSLNCFCSGKTISPASCIACNGTESSSTDELLGNDNVSSIVCRRDRIGVKKVGLIFRAASRLKMKGSLAIANRSVGSSPCRLQLGIEIVKSCSLLRNVLVWSSSPLDLSAVAEDFLPSGVTSVRVAIRAFKLNWVGRVPRSNLPSSRGSSFIVNGISTELCCAWPVASTPTVAGS